MNYAGVIICVAGSETSVLVRSPGTLAEALPPNHPAWKHFPLETLVATRHFIEGQRFSCINSTESKPAQKEQFDMSAPIVQDIKQYRGRDITSLSPQAIMDAIKADKRAIRDLQDTGVESTYITAEVARIQTGIDALVAELNTRV
jgi:hypothetical protein